MAYETLKDLVEAIKSGEVDLDEHSPLMLDNDNTNMHTKPPEGLDDDAEDAWHDEHYVEIFSMHPADLLEEALALLGIPCEGV